MSYDISFPCSRANHEWTRIDTKGFGGEAALECGGLTPLLGTTLLDLRVISHVWGIITFGRFKRNL